MSSAPMATEPIPHQDEAAHRCMGRGFTLIEVLLVMVITVVAFIGILQLQARATSGVSDARDIALATNLAGHFIETVKTESLRWQNDAGLSTNQVPFRYLNNADGTWHSAYLDGGGGNTMIGRMGNALALAPTQNPATNALDRGLLSEFPLISPQASYPVKFCVFYRLTPLIINTAFRLETRVMFRPTGGGLWVGAYGQCSPLSVVPMSRDLADVRTISVMSVVGKNTAGL